MSEVLYLSFPACHTPREIQVLPKSFPSIQTKEDYKNNPLIIHLKQIYVLLQPQTFSKLQDKNGRLPEHLASMPSSYD
jgi:hypothetical protein